MGQWTEWLCTRILSLCANVTEIFVHHESRCMFVIQAPALYCCCLVCCVRWHASRESSLSGSPVTLGERENTSASPPKYCPTLCPPTLAHPSPLPDFTPSNNHRSLPCCHNPPSFSPSLLLCVESNLCSKLSSSFLPIHLPPSPHPPPHPSLLRCSSLRPAAKFHPRTTARTSRRPHGAWACARRAATAPWPRSPPLRRPRKRRTRQA